MTMKDLVLERLVGVNEVTGWLTPNGDLCLCLTHSATDDEALIVRIRDDLDILDPSWEREEYDIINENGNWPIDELVRRRRGAPR